MLPGLQFPLILTSVSSSLSFLCFSLVRCLPGQTLPDSIKNTYTKGHWTEFMGRVMNYIGKNHPFSLWCGCAYITSGVQQ